VNKEQNWGLRICGYGYGLRVMWVVMLFMWCDEVHVGAMSGVMLT